MQCNDNEDVDVDVTACRCRCRLFFVIGGAPDRAFERLLKRFCFCGIYFLVDLMFDTIRTTNAMPVRDTYTHIPLACMPPPPALRHPTLPAQSSATSVEARGCAPTKMAHGWPTPIEAALAPLLLTYVDSNRWLYVAPPVLVSSTPCEHEPSNIDRRLSLQ